MDGIGFIGLPLSDHDTEGLIGVCRQSRIYEGEQSTTELSVPSSLQLKPSHILVHNAAWVKWLDELVDVFY